MATNDPMTMAIYNKLNALSKKDERPQAATAKKRGPYKKAPPRVDAQAARKPGPPPPVTISADDRPNWLSRMLLAELASNPRALSQVAPDTRLALIHHLSRLTP